MWFACKGRSIAAPAGEEDSCGTTNYLYDGLRAIEDVDGSGNILARYTAGGGIDEPLAELLSTTTSYYQQDG
ncbi:MAG TPA: hypothetical protein VMP68_13415, partial [Candidatus Eisenbacteria bacterium]|nr:hypothetical protein [Candidatus Eisenbacteria bacterium]